MAQRPKILIIDDDADVLKAAVMSLAHEVDTEILLSPEGLAAKVAAGGYSAVLVDMNFAVGDRSGAAGFDALRVCRDADPDLSVVLMTTFGGVALAVEALKRGAADFVLKPWRNEALVASVLAAVARTARARDDAAVKTLDALEAEEIKKALAKYGGNVSQAAQALGVTRPALYRRMARHGL